MTNEINEKKSPPISSARDHLANERTFLAWIRTSIGIMAFGFVVEKFALFLRQVSLLISSADLSVSTLKTSSLQGYSSILGALLVGFGVVICLLAFIQFINVRKQIEKDVYHPSIWLNALLTLSVTFVGIILAIYLY